MHYFFCTTGIKLCCFGAAAARTSGSSATRFINFHKTALILLEEDMLLKEEDVSLAIMNEAATALILSEK
jgi:hypothetical protein